MASTGRIAASTGRGGIRFGRSVVGGAAMLALVLALVPQQAAQAADMTPLRTAPTVVQPAPPQPVAPSAAPQRAAPPAPAPTLSPRVLAVQPVAVNTPKAGETIPLAGGVIQVQFGTKNLDPSKPLYYMPELVRNGAPLGPVFAQGFMLNKNLSSHVVGVKAGRYLVNFADQLAAAGGGYQYRITVYEGAWGKGHTVVAAGLSGVFSFGP